MGDTFQKVQLRGTKLIIDGHAYSEKDMDSLPAQLSPANLATRRSNTVVIFFGRASPLSNHHPSPFLLDDHKFSCVEQFLAWKRAKIADNKPLITKALSSTNPTTCKTILNELHNSNLEAWEEQIEGIISSALYAKFAQNSSLATYLLDTRPLQLGEASLNSKWGIGLKLTDQDALNPSKWAEGGNLLGSSLMETREELFSKRFSN